MSILICPICCSADFEMDDDGVITYCYCCEEQANGYRPYEEDEDGVIY